MTIKLYGLPQCGTCKKAMAWLDNKGLAYQFIDYRATPVPAAQLAEWAAQLGWEKLVNRASMTWRQLPEQRKQPADEGEWQALVAEFPALIKRPVSEVDAVVAVGFSEKAYAQRFS